MDYKLILMEQFGYKEYEADLTIEDISMLDDESKEILDKFFNGATVGEYACGDFSVEKLNNEYGFNVIAAVIAISNLKKNYAEFSRLYSSGIK